MERREVFADLAIFGRLVARARRVWEWRHWGEAAGRWVADSRLLVVGVVMRVVLALGPSGRWWGHGRRWWELVRQQRGDRTKDLCAM